MVNPKFAAKALRAISKNSNISIGFENDPTDWVSTGNYLLNYLISGDFFKGIPLGKVTMLYGDSGAGKSFISASVVKHAQQQGIFPVIIDTENALDEAWLAKLGVDTAAMLMLKMSMIDDVAKSINDFIASYKEEPEKDRMKLLFVIDSLGMLLTPSDVKQFEGGEVSKGDMGRKPKALTALVRNCVNMFGNLNIGMIATNHSYASQDPYNPDDKISGGGGFVYASSIVVGMKKKKLKEDEEGNKTKEVLGLRSGCKIVKSRYNKPFEEVELDIPWETGLNPYSGLFEFFYDKKKMLVKTGGGPSLGYVYTDLEGKEHKYSKRDYLSNVDGIYDLIMTEFAKKELTLPKDKTVVANEEEEDT